MSAYPDNVSQADIDAAFGRSLSDDAEDALTTHAHIQTLRTTLLEAIRANDGVMGFGRYEELEATLIDAEYTAAQLEEIVGEEDAERRLDLMYDAAERRAEMLRDWDYAS